MNAKIYLVGGAVRDIQMGLVPHDFDFVAVGATPEDFNGWELVGKDFPVFLEPKNGWEVALARQERKSGTGYTGFTVCTDGVSLEDDLSRRDLTINAMAIEVDWEATVELGRPVTVGRLIDPFNGLYSLENKELVNVSSAFREDPLRVLRVCRFMAKFPEFEINEELMEEMVKCAEELDHVTAERVWAETEKAFMCAKPSRFFETLCELSHKVDFKLYQDLFNLEKATLTNEHHQEKNAFVHTMMVLEDAVQRYADLPEEEKKAIFLACIMHDLGKWPTLEATGKMHGHESDGIPYVKEFCEKFKVSKMQKRVALMTTEYHLKVHNILGRGKNAASKPSRVMQFFEETGALNKPEHFKLMLKACESDHRGRISSEIINTYRQRFYLEECLEAVINMNTKEISQKMIAEGKSGVHIGEAIRVARIEKIRKVFKEWIAHIYS